MKGALVARFAFSWCLCALLAVPAAGQELPAPAGQELPPPAGEEEAATAGDEAGPAPASRPFRLGGEFKAHFRNSRAVEVLHPFPFPPSFIPVGETAVFMRTVDPGSHLELSNLAVTGEGDLMPGVSARVEVHVLDLYSRNPVSTDDRIFLRDAWIRLGASPAFPEPSAGTSAYLLVGQAPRFTRQAVRRMESYGLWGTAVGRFENPQVQLGGFVGENVYWRAQGGIGNPLFFRDPNALAGDNGTPDRAPGAPDPILQSGFPILYDAKPTAKDLSGRFEWGVGLGARWHWGTDSGADVLGWYFQRDLEEVVALPGTFYSGDLKLLRGPGTPLPISGDGKREAGVNLEARAGGFRLFGQYVNQEIAELPRQGFELELAWVGELEGLFLIGETPAFNWLQPVVRVSLVDNDFVAPRGYPGPSVAWDWVKVDLGVRVGVVRDVHLTLEYARHDMKTRRGSLHPDEFLATLRVGF
ncbi:MAG TPA: hypothetical protein VII13_12605 [Vicinamibacteria bacterium]